MPVRHTVTLQSSGKEFRNRARRDRARGGAAGWPGVAVFVPCRRLRQLQGDADRGALHLPAQSADRAQRGRAGAPNGAPLDSILASEEYQKDAGLSQTLY